MAAASPHRLFTADEVARMVEAGVLREDEPLELLGGELVVVSPQGPEHAGGGNDAEGPAPHYGALRVHDEDEPAILPGTMATLRARDFLG